MPGINSDLTIKKYSKVMWEVIKDLIKFIAQLLAKRKATFEAVVRCKYTMNSKGKQQSQFTLILQNVGKGDAKNIEISSDDIYLIFNKHFDIVSTGKVIQSPISLVISNPNDNFRINVDWNDSRKHRQKNTIIANVEYD
jgi:hypothetical protein